MGGRKNKKIIIKILYIYVEIGRPCDIYFPKMSSSKFIAHRFHGNLRTIRWTCIYTLVYRFCTRELATTCTNSVVYKLHINKYRTWWKEIAGDVSFKHPQLSFQFPFVQKEEADVVSAVALYFVEMIGTRFVLRYCELAVLFSDY